MEDLIITSLRFENRAAGAFAMQTEDSHYERQKLIESNAKGIARNEDNLAVMIRQKSSEYRSVSK